jgi:hypothetical protein
MSKKVQAVYDDDIEEFLRSIGEYDKVLSGRLKCKYCDSTITLENISKIFPESGSIKFVCNKSECIIKSYELE